MKKIIGIILLCLVHLNGVAQEQYKFRLIDVVDGLSDNQIRGLSVTPDGRIGIRTASILNIYDGASFEHFPYDKDKSMFGPIPVRLKNIMTDRGGYG